MKERSDSKHKRNRQKGGTANTKDTDGEEQKIRRRPTGMRNSKNMKKVDMLHRRG